MLEGAVDGGFGDAVLGFAEVEEEDSASKKGRANFWSGSEGWARRSVVYLSFRCLRNSRKMWSGVSMR